MIHLWLLWNISFLRSLNRSIKFLGLHFNLIYPLLLFLHSLLPLFPFFLKLISQRVRKLFSHISSSIHLYLLEFFFFCLSSLIFGELLASLMLLLMTVDFVLAFYLFQLVASCLSNNICGNFVLRLFEYLLRLLIYSCACYLVNICLYLLILNSFTLSLRFSFPFLFVLSLFIEYFFGFFFQLILKLLDLFLVLFIKFVFCFFIYLFFGFLILL